MTENRIRRNHELPLRIRQQLDKTGNALRIVGVMIVAVKQDGIDSGGSRTFNVFAQGVAYVPGFVRFDVVSSQRRLKDCRIGFGCADSRRDVN